jgi:hypothetical protein
MPRGPKGERRPADVIGAAVMVGRIATGEVDDSKNDPTKQHHRRGGLKGGKARAAAPALDLAAGRFRIARHPLA